MQEANNSITRWVDALCRRSEYEKAAALLGDHLRLFPDERWAAELLAQVRRKAQQSELAARLSADAFDGEDAEFIDGLDEDGGDWSVEDLEPQAKVAASLPDAVAEQVAGGDPDPNAETDEFSLAEEPAEVDFDASDLDLLSSDGDAWAELDGTVSDVEFDAAGWEEVEDPTSPVDPEVLGSGRIELERRARISAARLAEGVEWLHRDLPVLQEILTYHQCHPKTVAALRHLIPLLDVSPSELRTAFNLRIYWAECEAFHRGWNGSDELSSVTWQNISWGLSLAIVRYLGTEDIDEIADWLHSCFEDWTRWHIRGRYHPTFHSYLVFLLDHLDKQEAIIGHRVPAYLEFELFAEQSDALPGSPLWQSLEAFGLFPKNLERPSCYSVHELGNIGVELPGSIKAKDCQ